MPKLGISFNFIIPISYFTNNINTLVLFYSAPHNTRIEKRTRRAYKMIELTVMSVMIPVTLGLLALLASDEIDR